MEFTDKNKTEIKDEDNLLISLDDEMEPGGKGMFVTNVKLCFYDGITKKYIPLSEYYKSGSVKDGVVVRNYIDTKIIE